MSQEEKNIPVEQQRLEKEQIEDMGSVYRTRGAHAIHCLTVIGQVEGHVEAPQGQKTTKYEHVIPQLVAVQEDPAVEGLLVLINTVGGDVEAGLALAELIASISKPSATVVLGGGHSIGIPLAAGVFVPLGLTLNPMFGAAAMSLSSFCVVSNALRLNLFKLRDPKHDHKRRKKPASANTAPAEEKATTKKEKETMKKTMKIEGMMCAHCEATVKKALEAIPEVVDAEVSHTAGTAVVTLQSPVDDAALKKAVEDKDYKVLGIE